MTFCAISAVLVLIVSTIGGFFISAIHRRQENFGTSFMFLVGFALHVFFSIAFFWFIATASGVDDDSWIWAVVAVLMGVVLLAPVFDKSPPWPTPAVRPNA